MAEIEIYAKPSNLYRYRKLDQDALQEIAALLGAYVFCPAYSELNDPLKERYRSSKNLETMVRARQAERLSLEYERAELVKLGIDREVKWTAIEDDGAGYDILSYRMVGNVIRPILIDAKSTIASPLRFNVSPNEWKEADAVGPAYRFHIWDLKQMPPKLFVRTVEDVRPHIPQDGVKGEWTNVRIPVAIDQKLDEIDADWI